MAPLLFIPILAYPQSTSFEFDNDPSQSLVLGKNAVEISNLASEKINLNVVATGLWMAQTNPIMGDFNSLVDVSNAQFISKKSSGLFQFYLQGGYYSIPSLGSTYQRASQQTADSFGLLPLASVSINPSQNWLFTVGKINSFGGFENTFTYQNNNIDRGLLWNQTSNVSRGAQASYKQGSTTAAFSVNDGFYSNELSWMGASLSFDISESNSATAIWSGSIKTNPTNSFITPVAQNNSQIFNLIFTHRSNQWSVTPYVQYTYVPANPSLGILSSAQTSGVALLSNYKILGEREGSTYLPFRFEFITSAGKTGSGSPNLLYGVGSAAWSATITPTYQLKTWFIRGELSYVKATNISPGMAFGNAGNVNSQARGMLETGFLF